MRNWVRTDGRDVIYCTFKYGVPKLRHIQHSILSEAVNIVRSITVWPAAELLALPEPLHDQVPHPGRGQSAAGGHPGGGSAGPWIGSNMEVWPGCRLPEAAMPMPPCSMAPRSVRMSPNRLEVTTTSNHSGFLIIHMQAAST